MLYNLRNDEHNFKFQEKKSKKKRSIQAEKNQIKTEILCGQKDKFDKIQIMHRSVVSMTPIIGYQVQTVSSIALLRVRGDQDIRYTINIISS